MQSTVAPLEDNKVKVSVQITEAEFDRDLDAAFRKISKEVRLPGFRPGKAPRKVLEARLGTSAAREQALNDSLGRYLWDAVREHDVDIIAQPSIDITAGQESGPIEFDATVEVRPKVIVPGYNGLRVELPSPVLTDEEANAPIEAELGRHGSLNDVERPAVRGDQITVNLSATRDGDPVPGLNVEDWLYEVGKGWVADSFDIEVIGMEAGDTKTFTALPSGTEEPADFTVTVSKVQEKVLPELTDDWVADNVGEFETVDAWRTSITDRLTLLKKAQFNRALVERTTSALGELVVDDVPEVLVNADFQQRANNFVEQIQQQGIQLEQYMQITGQDQDQLIANIREGSDRAVRVDLALRAVIEAEGIAVSDDDLEAEYSRIAQSVREKPATVRKAYEKNDAVRDLRVDLAKRKALDVVLDRVEVVDPEGHPIDKALYVIEPEADSAASDTDETQS